MVTSPALGILAAPILASVAVRLNYGNASTYILFILHTKHLVDIVVQSM